MFITLAIGLIVTVSLVVTYSALSISSPDNHGYERKRQTSLPPAKYFSFETSKEFLEEEEQD